MSEEKKNEVTEEVKEARKLSEEELEQVSGGTGDLVHLDIYSFTRDFGVPNPF